MKMALQQVIATSGRSSQRDDVRENISGILKKFFPDYSLPECVDISLDDLSDELLRLTLKFPATANDDGERAGFVYDLYENFTYLFGKGCYDAQERPHDESMVWYVPKNQRIARQMLGWVKG